MPDNKKSTETTRRINLTDRFYQYMLTLFSRLRLATITAATLLTACISETERLEQEAAAINAERHAAEYSEYCAGLHKKHVEFMKNVAAAASAEFVRERGDCCCTGAELEPAKGVKLSHAEFTELKEILSHAQPIQPQPSDRYQTSFKTQVVTDKDGNPKLDFLSTPVVVSPMAFYIVDRLVLKDRQGKELMHFSADDGICRSSSSQSQQNAVAALPDEWFERYINLPARQRFIRNTNKADDVTAEPALLNSTAQTEPHWKGRELSAKAAQQNRDFTDKVRQAANNCSSIQVQEVIFGAQNQTGSRVTLSAEHKTELCRMLSQAQPILNVSNLIVHPGKKTEIIFLDEAGSTLLSISSLEIGTPSTSTQESRILIPSEDETRLRKIIGEK
ncbi:MAG: hypothetical protein Q4F40_05305 [Akkermansia sp.]|nr:hypothetical protein [Akkermansia sp.]